MKGARADDPVYLSDDEGRCRRKRQRAGKPRIETMCSEPYLCERTKTKVDTQDRTTKSAIRYYIREMNKTSIAPGQRMYFSAPFTRRYLASYLEQSIEDSCVQLACG